MLNDGRDSDDSQAPADPGRTVGEEYGAGPASPGRAVTGLEADVLAAIASAVLAPDRAEGERQLRALLDSGLDRHSLIDDWIPRLARRFGEAWFDSGHSFAEVTIAVGRLQGWLREIEPPRRDSPFCLDAPEVLMVVAEGAHHTLGAMVAMSRFRRLGALVRLSLGQDARTVGHLVRTHHVDMVAISAAGNEDLEFLGMIINSIRSGVGPAPYIVLGGEILNQKPDASVLIGADYATSDPEEALRFCGLSTSASAERRPKAGQSAARERPERVPTGA